MHLMILSKSMEVIVSVSLKKHGLLRDKKDKVSLNAFLKEVDWKNIQVGNKRNIL